MILLKTREEIERIRTSANLLSRAIAEVGRHVRPGVTTGFLDKLGEQFIRDNGGIPLCKNYDGFPSAFCMSVNDVVVHGIPSDSMFLHEGDNLSVDCVVELNGFVSDSCYTFAVGEIGESLQRLHRVTKEALYIGINQCKLGNRIGDISHAIQQHCEKNGYNVVRELCGHGVGFKMHESPNVPNYGVKGTGPLIKEGMVIAIEPMVCMGSKNVKFSKVDGWTCSTKDGKCAAHYEHTVAITPEGPEILTSFEEIENQ